MTGKLPDELPIEVHPRFKTKPMSKSPKKTLEKSSSPLLLITQMLLILHAKSMADTWFIRAHETQHRSSSCTWVRVLVLSTPTLLETVDWNDFLPKISCQWKVCSQCSADIHNQRWHHSPSVCDRTLSKPGGNLTQCSSLEDTTLQVAQPWSSNELHGNKVRAAWNF